MKRFLKSLLCIITLFALVTPSAYAQTNYCGGTVCDGYHSCGGNVTVFGRITYQNGYGVPGVPITIFDHNRNNANYPSGAAYTTVITDQNGDYTLNNFVCGDPTINFGDTYAIRPDWGACIQGYSCTNVTPLSIESQQALKPSANPQLTDCANNNGCNFTVTLVPNGGQVLVPLQPVSLFSEAITSFAPYAIIGYLVFHIMF